MIYKTLHREVNIEHHKPNKQKAGGDRMNLQANIQIDTEKVGYNGYGTKGKLAFPQVTNDHY